MARVYGLLDMKAHPATLIADLTVNLPDGSFVWRELDTSRAWTLEAHLLATLVDQMNMWMWGNADRRKRGAKPEPLPRPGERANAGAQHIKPQPMSVEAMDEFLRGRFEDVTSRAHLPDKEE